MTFSGPELLDSLGNAPWQVAARTYGNSHATLIGLMVNWWIMLDPAAHWALESGPSFGHRPKGTGGGMCDAILGQGSDAVGVLEVEGLRPRLTAEKLGKFFKAEYDDLKSLRFAVLLLYAYGPRGQGAARAIPPAGGPAVLDQVIAVSAAYPEKSIVVITLDKTYERQQKGIRKRSQYYWGRPGPIRGSLYQGGERLATCTFYEQAEVRGGGL